MYKRGSLITSKYIDKTIQIHNGTRFFEITVTKNMVGQKFGEFSPSRVKPIHKKKKK
jgi:small subunit ribosomal protein S19